MAKMDMFYSAHEGNDEVEWVESPVTDGEIPAQLAHTTAAVIEACARNGDLVWLADKVAEAIALKAA
jgi:hypothetical protein